MRFCRFYTNQRDVADVVRRSGSESSAASCKPMAGRHKDDSSVTSDELLFKGTVSRRSGRELAREPSRNPIRAPTREPAPAHPRESIREPTNKTSQHMEWKYRGRSKTEAVSTEPIPAPGGATAQRSEGFQRFYKAVVSPTHVRVTAGGRIVPNTRGPPSPTTTRTNDNPAADSQSVPDKATSGRPSLNPIGVGQPATAVPQLIPGYPPGFQPIQTPVSFVPMAFGAHLPPGVSFAQHASNPSTVNPPVTGALTADNILKDMHNTKSTDARTEGYVTDDKQGNVKISPHELFDYTKPYYYNGQIIYPVGPFPPSLGNPMVPIHMVGVPHGLPHGLPHGVSQSIHHGATLQLPGHYQSQPTSATPTVTGTSYAPSNNGLGGIPFAVRHVAPGNANPNAAIAPPPSSIKLSDITKKQISSFKQSLKYHEDQLQYNRHQIDEKDMETRIQTIMGHIQRFETTLKSQLEYEEAQRKAGRGEEDDIPSQSAAAAEGDQAWAQPAPSPEPGVNIMNESDEAIRRRVALASYGLNTNIGEGGKAVFRCPTEPAFPITNAQTMGLSLPSEAALAPAFQPRGYSSSWEGSEHAREKAAKEEAEKQFLTAESRKFEHMGASAQRSISHPFATPYLAMLPRVEGNYEAPTSTNRTGNNSIGKHLRPNLGVPYLLGTLPKDVNPRTARDQDYVYKRPLTEEERRARFLYWGKAPKSAVKGLPKFDGKHFYPPSPVKERPAVFSQEGAPDGHRSIDHRQAESDCDPFRSMTPVERIDSRVVTASEDNCIANRHSRTISFDTQVNSGSEDSQMTGGAPLMYRESSLDASSVGSAERRSEKSGYVIHTGKYHRSTDTMADNLTQREALAGCSPERPNQQRTLINHGTRPSAALRRARRCVFEPIVQY